MTYPREMIRLAWCAVVLMSVCGCSEKGPERFQVTGKVTYRGKSVPAGTITFEPQDMVLNATTIGEAEITDGQYTTRVDKGVVGGTQKVFVSGYNGIREPGSGPFGASVFATYTVEIDLPTEPSTYDFEVPSVR